MAHSSCGWIEVCQWKMNDTLSDKYHHVYQVLREEYGIIKSSYAVSKPIKHPIKTQNPQYVFVIY